MVMYRRSGSTTFAEYPKGSKKMSSTSQPAEGRTASQNRAMAFSPIAWYSFVKRRALSGPSPVSISSVIIGNTASGFGAWHAWKL